MNVVSNCKKIDEDSKQLKTPAVPVKVKAVDKSIIIPIPE